MDNKQYKKGQYVSLHNHTEFSLQDGDSRIEKLVQRAKDYGMKSLAVTDHGVMFATVAFYEACTKAGIKPIIGSEIYFTAGEMEDKSKTNKGPGGKTNYHLLLLVKNQKGYENLVKIVSIAQEFGMYHAPRVDYKTLAKYSEGLVCSSACLGGILAQTLLDGVDSTLNSYDESHYEIVRKNIPAAIEVAKKHQEIFGKENYFVEIMNHETAANELVNDFLIEVADAVGATVIATNDAHYVDKEDYASYNMRKAIRYEKTIEEITDVKGLGVEGNYLYLKNEEEMLEVFPEKHHFAISNTALVADMCNFELKYQATRETAFPVYIFNEGEEEEVREWVGSDIYNEMPQKEQHYAYLRMLTEKGLNKKYSELTQEIIERRDEELNVISSMGFVDYYLIVMDFIHFAKQQGIYVGPGRGSGAGSLIAYAIDITNIEPIAPGLLFSRFLNKERVSMPDFDVDFPDESRQDVIDYVVRKYGKDQVAMIYTGQYRGNKRAVLDTAKPLGFVRNGEGLEITKLITDPKTPLTQLYEESEELRAIFNRSDRHKEWFKYAVMLEDSLANTSTHASGVIIADRPVRDLAPLVREVGKDQSMMLVQYNMIEAEEIGLLKFDFLGISTLTALDNANKDIQARNPEFDIMNIPFDDKKTFELISSGNTTGVFQLESKGMQATAQQLRISSLPELITLIALYRPGPMQNIGKYAFNKDNPSEIEFIHEAYTEVTAETYGILVYQEQIMSLLIKIAGYSEGRSDNFRRIMGKKLTSALAEERKIFIEGLRKPNGEYIMVNGSLVKISDDNIVNIDKNFNSHDINGNTISLQGIVDETGLMLGQFDRYDANGNINNEFTEVVPGAVKHSGLTPLQASQMMDQMEEFAKYAFNKAHSAAYGDTAYKMAYVKAHYPETFYASKLATLTDPKKLKVAINSMKKESGLTVVGPDINESLEKFSGANGTVRYGLSAIKAVKGHAKEIVEERLKNGAYKSINDFMSRNNKITKTVLVNLDLTGAFVSLNVPRGAIANNIDKIVAALKKTRGNKNEKRIPLSVFLKTEDKGVPTVDIMPLIENSDTMTDDEIIAAELELLKINISIDLLDRYSKMVETLNLKTVSEISEMIEQGNVADGSYQWFAIMPSVVNKRQTRNGDYLMAGSAYDADGSVEFVAFNKTLTTYGNLFEQGKLILVNGRITKGNEDDEFSSDDKITINKLFAVPNNDATVEEINAFMKNLKENRFTFKTREISTKPKTHAVEVKESKTEVAGMKTFNNINIRKTAKHETGLYLHVKDEEQLMTVLPKLKEIPGSTKVFVVSVSTGKMAILQNYQVDLRKSADKNKEIIELVDNHIFLRKIDN